jgi:hypothetical protein
MKGGTGRTNRTAIPPGQCASIYLIFTFFLYRDKRCWPVGLILLAFPASATFPAGEAVPKLLQAGRMLRAALAGPITYCNTQPRESCLPASVFLSR